MKVLSSVKSVGDYFFIFNYLRSCQKERSQQPLYFFSPICEDMYNELLDYLYRLDFLRKNQVEEAEDTLLKISQGEFVNRLQALNIGQSQKVLVPYLKNLKTEQESPFVSALIKRYVDRIEKSFVPGERIILFRLLSAWHDTDRALLLDFLESNSTSISTRELEKSKFALLDLRKVDKSVDVEEHGFRKFDSPYFILCHRRGTIHLPPPTVCHDSLKNFTLSFKSGELLKDSFLDKRGQKIS